MLAHGGVHGKGKMGRVCGGRKEIPEHPLGASGGHDGKSGNGNMTGKAEAAAVWQQAGSRP